MTNNGARIPKVILPMLATVAIVAPLAWLWQASRVPSVYSVMDMGYRDYGVGTMADTSGGGHGGHMQGDMPGQQMVPPRLVTVRDRARTVAVAACCGVYLVGHSWPARTMLGLSKVPSRKTWWSTRAL